MPLRKEDQRYDIDGDGVASASDIENSEKIQNLQLDFTRAAVRRKMAVSSLISINVFTAVLFTDLVSTARVQALAEVSGMFYLTMGGIIAAYFGTTAWLTRK